jgi:DNA polymerase-3 subunit beta
MERSAGRCVVSGRLLDALVKSLPPKPVTIDVSDEQMTLTCGPVRATLPLMPAEDYPSLPVAPEPIGQINAQQFAKEVGRVLPACDITGTIASLPALTGVHIAFGDHGLIVTASNRYQLATNSDSGRPSRSTSRSSSRGPSSTASSRSATTTVRCPSA